MREERGVSVLVYVVFADELSFVYHCFARPGCASRIWISIGMMMVGKLVLVVVLVKGL